MFKRHTSDYEDIVAFDRLSGGLAVLDYPMDDMGRPILPRGVPSWLGRRGMAWECFCATIENHACPIKWTATTGIGTCQSAQCALQIDLEKILQTTRRFSAYPDIPTLASLHNDLNLPPPVPHRPYFGVARRYGLMNNNRSTARSRGLHVTLRIQAQPVPAERHGLYQSSSSSSASSSTSIVRNPSELGLSQKRLVRLIEGHGLEPFDALNLIERCDGCGKHFLDSFLRAHIVECRGGSVEI
ncbi:hypothetical protein BD410DRAFT_787158 [Rickenella mellea]|uniref:Uncharacterized protein n=1 Tax=Rickenella mellea TaxID=50990 RepID=A0A4Y7QAL6_9AGAM|nr:hypothetical protein BD410DRAFT_797522 [Rickenella mellea]TDL23860.1 hypothetical protein BD410DRAFT_787158 [Rickenella mellea]